MPGTLRVHWTIHNSISIPRPILRCSRCDAPRAFVPSGKFRLNANGKRLDAWLIYRCEICADSWNRTVFERKRRAEIDGGVLEALQSNDAVFADEIARDVAGLARWTRRFDNEGEAGIAIDKVAIEGTLTLPDRVVIGLSFSSNAGMRCDRVLAAGLEIARSRVATLAAEGRIVVDGGSRRPLARMLGSGARIYLAIDGLADARLLSRRAVDIETADPSAIAAFRD